MCVRIAFALLLVAGLSFAPAFANTITVNDASSGSVAGKCTIQDAVTAANTNAAVQGCVAGSAGADTIVFAPGIVTITLNAAMTSANPSCTFALAVSEDLSIDGGAVAGSGVPKVTIARSSAAGTAKFGIIGASNSNCGQTSAKLRLTLAGLTLSNGNNAGNFDVDGGGIAADIITITDSVVSGNVAGYGGGIYAFSSLTMASSSVSGNSVTGFGSGGGIAGVTLTISGSTINGNSASQGGGLYADGLITLVNSTVSGNTASEGGGIYTSAITTNFVTVTANNGGADYRGGSGINLQVNEAGLGVEFDNSVIAGNASAEGAQDLDTQAAVTIRGANNYIGTLGPVAQNDLAAGVNIAACAHLNLGALANNGGGTQTHAILSGSCLIDAGVASTSIAFDQRGTGYPRVVNGHADIGAFEYQGGPAPVNGACGSDNGQTLLVAPVNLCSAGSASAVTGTGHPWAWTCSGSNGGSNASCSATIKTWTVSAAAGAGGSVAPTSQSVDNGATAQITASTSTGYALTGASGCGGALGGNVYTTAAVGANCTVNFVFTAVAKPVPTVTLGSSANPATAGQSLTLTVSVNGNAGAASGTVAFLDGTVTLAGVPVASPGAVSTTRSASATLNAAGQASITLSTLAVGSHTLTAAYSGDGVYAGSTSNSIVETITAAAPIQPAIAAPTLSVGWLALLAGFITALGLRGAARHHGRKLLLMLSVIGLAAPNARAQSGFNPGTDMLIESLAVQSDGKIVLGGAFASVDGAAHTGIARLNGDGSLDNGFAGSTDFDVLSILPTPDGKLLIGGFFNNVDGQAHRALMRLNGDGSLDNGFLSGHTGPYDSVLAEVNAIAVQTDGKILIGGEFSKVNGTARNGIARLNTDGSLDTTFAASSLAYVNASGVSLAPSVQTLAIQADGKVLISGLFTTINGSTRNYLARLNTDGSLDTGFSSSLDNLAYSILVQSDGKIVLGGGFTVVNGLSHPFAVRLFSAGSIDGGFAPNPAALPGLVYSLALQSDGKILVGGAYTSGNGGTHNAVVRLGADGSADSTFNPATVGGGKLNFVYALALQANGKILIGGDFTSVDGSAHAHIARLNSDGTLDLSAGSAGAAFNPDQRGLTGTWYNPATSGQGIVMQVAPDLIATGEGVLFGGWFTYDVKPAGGADKQRWYTLQGNVSASSASPVLDIYTATGGNFNAAPKVGASKVGSATLTFADCSHASLVYSFSDGSSRSGSIALSRLDSDASCSAAGDNGAAVGHGLLSGTWYDPTTSGQGLVVDVAPAQNTLFAGWYTYAPNGSSIGGGASQRWYTVQGSLSANLSTTATTLTLSGVPIYTATGGVFDDPTKSTNIQVGTTDIVFTGCGAMTLNYRFSAGSNQGASGKLNLMRLGPTPQGCSL
jgi:uncharacterized delta-60 repeat protein